MAMEDGLDKDGTTREVKHGREIQVSFQDGHQQMTSKMARSLVLLRENGGTGASNDLKRSKLQQEKYGTPPTTSSEA